MPRERYSRSRVPSLSIPESDYANRMNIDRFMEAQILSRPEASRGFGYEQLEERYPMTPIEVRRQRAQDTALREEDLAYKAGIIKEREAELALKKSARDLDMYESQINREDAMLEQIPIARQKLAELDVRDPNFINKAYDIQDQHPMAFESQEFQKYVFQPMLNRNSRLSGRRQEGIVTDADLKEAMGEISKYNELIAARGEGIGPSPEEERYLGFRQNQIDQFYAQRGMTAPTMAAPQPAGIAPQSMPAPSAQQFSFSSVEEAESAGLPTGTIVYINGRKARID